MSATTRILQENLVDALIAFIDDDWERIVMNYESQLADQGRVVDYILFYIKATPDGDYEDVSFPRASDEINDAFIELADTIAREGERWGSCDVVVDADGRYDLSFCYDPPDRITGRLDAFRRFDSYRAERAARAAG